MILDCRRPNLKQERASRSSGCATRFLTISKPRCALRRSPCQRSEGESRKFERDSIRSRAAHVDRLARASESAIESIEDLPGQTKDWLLQDLGPGSQPSCSSDCVTADYAYECMQPSINLGKSPAGQRNAKRCT